MTLIGEPPLHLVRQTRQLKANCCPIWWRECRKHLPNRIKTNPQQQVSEVNRRVQFNKQIGVRTLVKGNQQSKSKQQPSNPSPTSIEKLQSAAHRYDKKFQDLVEEVNTKQRLGYKIIEYSDWPNKVTGKERSTISGMGYSRQFYGVAWSIMERKFGRPHVIIDAQQESIHWANQVETSGRNRSDQFPSCFFNLLEFAQRVRADWWSAIKLGTVYDSR